MIKIESTTTTQWMKGALLFLLLCWSSSLVASPPPTIAFAPQEKLTYVVSYKIGLANTNVAEAVLSTAMDSSKTHYEISANAKTLSLYRWFFDLNDTYISRIDAKTLRPIDLTIELHEAKYRVSAKYLYDWDKMRATTCFHNHAKETPSYDTLPLIANSFDGVALFYNLRCMDREELVPNKAELFHMVLEDTIRTVEYKFLGREEKSIRRLGRFKTLKFSCQLVTSEGVSFEDGTEMTIWISDDKNKIPLYVESPIRVGSIRVYLTDTQGLKYPLSSKIK